MAGHWTSDFSFVTGAIRTPELGYLVLSNDEAASKKIALANVVQWKPTGWGNGGQTKWRMAGAAIVRSPLEQLCAVGEFGGVLMLGSGDRHEETIGAGHRSPGDRGPLRGVRTIGAHVYVVGMDRQVYLRVADSDWRDHDAGIPVSGEDETVGFEAVDGFSETDMYAVGWDGEIWRFDGRKWSEESSPVNMVLVDVCCGGDGIVYACGRNGTLVAGRDGAWEVLEMTGWTDDIWSLAWFDGQLYASTMDHVFVLVNGRLQSVNMGAEQPKTCYRLVCGPGVMWSVGAKDVVAFDGTAWTRID